MKHSFQRQGLVNFFVCLWSSGDYMKMRELLNRSKSDSGLRYFSFWFATFVTDITQNCP